MKFVIERHRNCGKSQSHISFSFQFLNEKCSIFHPQNVKAALDHLHQLEALDDECCLTRKGHLMAAYPLEPKLSAALITASYEGCAEDVLLICAMLSEYTG